MEVGSKTRRDGGLPPPPRSVARARARGRASGCGAASLRVSRFRAAPPPRMQHQASFRLPGRASETARARAFDFEMSRWLDTGMSGSYICADGLEAHARHAESIDWW
jgi:hypothetical protein